MDRNNIVPYELPKQNYPTVSPGFTHLNGETLYSDGSLSLYNEIRFTPEGTNCGVLKEFPSHVYLNERSACEMCGIMEPFPINIQQIISENERIKNNQQ